MKIVYVFERRYCYLYDDKMFYIDQFKEKGYVVERWSLVQWTFKSVRNPLNMDDGTGTFYISDMESFQENIKRIRGEKCVFICYPYHAYTSISANIRKIIKKAGYSYFNLCESPNFSEETSKFSRATISFALLEEIKFFLYCTFGKKEMCYLSYREHWYPFVYKSNGNIMCTEANKRWMPNKFEAFSHRNYMVNSDDYTMELMRGETFLEEEEKNAIIFVDQYLTGHSDFLLNGIELPITNKIEYYDECNHFFSVLENKYNTKVIIAAHPKAEYEGSEFDGRKIIYGKTSSLIKNAKIVLLMTSSVYGITCLNRKKFIIISSKQMINGVQWKTLEDLKNYFKSNICIMSDVDMINIDEYVNQYGPLYEKYVSTYLVSKHGMFNKTIPEVIMENVEEMK